MANPFLIKPADYSQGFGMLSQGLQSVANKQQADAQKAQEAETMSQLQTAVDSGDMNQVSSFLMKNPQLSSNIQENIYKGMGIQEDARKEKFKTDLFNILSNPDQAEDIYAARIEEITKSGGDPSQTMAALGSHLKNPNGGLQQAEALAATMYPEEHAQWEKVMRGEQPEPMTEYQTEMVRQKDTEQELKRLEIEDKKLERQIKRETDELKRQELEQKIAENSNKKEAIRAEKEVAASDAYTAGQDTLDLISRIENHPGFSDYVGAKGLSSGFGLLDEPVGGTEAASVAGMIETLSSKNFMNSIQQMKGMGALSDAEGKKVSSAIESLNPNMKEEDFKRSLNVIKNITKRGMEKQRKIMGKTVESETKTVSWSDL